MLKREHDELTKRILCEQQNNPTAGDFTKMIKDDFKMCSIAYNEHEITSSHNEQYKKLIKTNLEKAAFNIWSANNKVTQRFVTSSTTSLRYNHN